ncbi:hypothetical protein [Ruegeria hyattellae]|uniref:hypothetical protein n=1 Tax=Ruegeria hyattellae TaxID=3233337 RepID=UPI00355BE34A
MIGALTVLFLLAVTLAIVRVAGVALRLTGLPQPVARFQAISALTGTGFTTSEAEGTMHHPVRRRVLTLLMFTGHLGIVSLASTVILTVASIEDRLGVVLQVFALVASVVAIVVLASSKWLDIVMCDWVARLMLRIGWMKNLPYEILYEAPDGRQLCEHVVQKNLGLDPELLIVSHNGVAVRQTDAPKLEAGDKVLAYARPAAHAHWSHAKSLLSEHLD